MNQRVLVLAVVVVVAAVAAVGLSAAATMSARGEPSEDVKPARQSADGSPSSSTARQQQSPEDIASYWTKERMRDARPIQKAVTGSTRPSASVPSSPGRTNPGSASEPTTEMTQKRKAAAQDDGAAGQAASDDGGVADYWTQTRMDEAQPLEKSPTDDAGGSSAGLPDSGGSTTPPTVP
jgi:hypothetical protein